MITSIERLINAGLLRFRLRSRAAMARAVRLTGAAVAAFAVARRSFPDTMPILAPLTALLVVEVTLKDILTSGVQRVASVTAGVLLAVALLRDRRADLVEPGRAGRRVDHDRPAAPARTAHDRGADQRHAGARRRRGRGRRHRPDRRDPAGCCRRCRGQPGVPARGPGEHRGRGRAPLCLGTGQAARRCRHRSA